MRRALWLAGAGILALAPVAASAADRAETNYYGQQQASLQVTAPTLTRSLVSVALQLPSTSTTDDYLRVFVAEIAASGANQPTIFSAIDAAIGTPGLPRSAIAALESLRKRVRPVRDYTGGIANQRSTIFSPSVSTSGGSDYLR